MNIVIDTNVIASAIFFGGKPQILIEEVMKENQTAFVSKEIVSEYKETVDYLLNKYPGKKPQIPLTQIVSKMNLIKADNDIYVCRDPDDDKFLSCAESGECFYIVSGDKDLLTLVEYKGIKILTVAQFLQLSDLTKK